MPNLCSYSMRIRGEKENVYEFHKRMGDYDMPNHLWRMFETDIYDECDNGDGTITGTFENFCPVAILIEGEGRPESPETGVFDFSYVWAVVAAVSALLIVAVIVTNNRARKNSK